MNSLLNHGIPVKTLSPVSLGQPENFTVIALFDGGRAAEYIKDGSEREYQTDFADPTYQLLRRVCERKEPGRRLPTPADDDWQRYSIFVETHVVADFGSGVQYTFDLPCRHYLPAKQVHVPQFDQ